MDTYGIYDGTDELGAIGAVAPGIFAYDGWCRRMVYETQWATGRTAGAGRVGREVELRDRWTKVWTCERHTDDLVGARRLAATACT